MARQRLVKAYGKKGVRKIDVSDEWKKCLHESPLTRVQPSSLLVSHKFQSNHLKKIHPNGSYLREPLTSCCSETSTSSSASDSTSSVSYSSQVDVSKETTEEDPCHRQSVAESEKETVWFDLDSESPIPRPNGRKQPHYKGTRSSGGGSGWFEERGTSTPTNRGVEEVGSLKTPSTGGRGCLQGLSTPHGGDSGRVRLSCPSRLDAREVSVVLEKMSLLSLSSRGHRISPLPPNRSDVNDHDKENRSVARNELTGLESPCVTGLLTPEDKEFLHEDSIEFAYHKMRLTPPGKSSTPKEKKQGHNNSDYISPLLAYLSPARQKVVSEEEKVLAICGQKDVVSINNALPPLPCDVLKLGEGVYGEVFSLSRENTGVVAIKIVPVEGSLVVNGEKQKTLKEMLPEMVITKELSLLRECGENQTSNFIHLYQVMYGAGAYPNPLVDAWKEWNVQHSSENDSPDAFPPSQRYVVFETEHGGVDLEHYKISRTTEAISVFWQVCGTLAVAEKELEFEHRDLHWGNVLVSPTVDKTVQFTVDGRRHEVATSGLRAVIIDYTLSRLEKEGCVSYNDLNTIDWLFDGEGDYQFEVYRMMRSETKSQWQNFHPKTNILWLHYLADKLCSKLKRPGKDIRSLQDSILGYSSSFDLFVNKH